MNIIQRITGVIRNPKRLVLWCLRKFSFMFTDSIYLQLTYYFNMGKKLNLKNPKTYNEKLNWLKLYQRKPEFTELVDKYSVKQYVKGIIGEEYVIPTLGLWEKPEEIDWESLPNKFVLKTTHGGGNTGVVICKNKDLIDKEQIKRKLDSSLKQDLYKTSREWPYKNIKRRIIAEPYLEDTKTKELRDYKFFCFNGEVKALFISSERQRREEPYFDFFDPDFNLLPIKQGHPNSTNKPAKPECFEEMKIIASKLSRDITHARIDLYEVNGRVYFGEITFYHFGAMVPFEPNEWDYVFGSWLKLPN